jgi:hypothetical protein
MSQVNTSIPFNHRLSAKIDDLVIALDANPPPLRRWWLRTQKRWGERRIPDVLRATAAVGAAIDLCACCQQDLGYPDINSFALCEGCRARGER